MLYKQCDMHVTIVTFMPKMNGLIPHITCTGDARITHLYVHACNVHTVIVYIRDMHVHYIHNALTNLLYYM